jgi:uncharacterized membrane protein
MKKKLNKIFFVLLVILAFFSILATKSDAVTAKDVTFDAEFYLNSYSDLRAAFGNDYDAAYNHFLNNRN